MNLFDQLVTEALKSQPDFSSLRIVVEKELLHHDILRILSHHDLLKHLTFIGGTCLRTCYGGVRLSEDLDFTGGSDFTRQSLSTMGEILVANLQSKYGLAVRVSEPLKDKNNVDTWKIKVETRPQQNHLPAQRINIGICSVPSYERRPMLLLNPYGVDMGTSGLIIQAESREEIFVDKIVAFGLRPNRIKHRDLWDMVWLHQQRVEPRLALLPEKLRDHNYKLDEFLRLFNHRKNFIHEDAKLSLQFKEEMRRFLPGQTMEKEDLWSFVLCLIEDLAHRMENR